MRMQEGGKVDGINLEPFIMQLAIILLLDLYNFGS